MQQMKVSIIILSQWHKMKVWETERGEQLMRKKIYSKNKIEEREVTSNIKAKIRKEFLKEKHKQAKKISGKEDSQILSKNFTSSVEF